MAEKTKRPVDLSGNEVCALCGTTLELPDGNCLLCALEDALRETNRVLGLLCEVSAGRREPISWLIVESAEAKAQGVLRGMDALRE